MDAIRMGQVIVTLMILVLASSAPARADQLFPELPAQLAELRAAVEQLGRQDSPPGDRLKAIQIARRAGLRATAGSVVLYALLLEPSAAVRVKAVRTLHQLGPTVALDSVRGCQLIKDGKVRWDASPAVRSEIISVLVTAGQLDPQPIIPALWRMVQEDDQPQVRLCAAEGLARIFLGLGPAPVEGHLENINPDHSVEHLAAFVPVVRDATRAVAAVLNDPNEELRIKALHAIQVLGPTAAQVAFPQLVKALQDESPAVRMEAVFALRQVGQPRFGLLLPHLLRLMKDENGLVRMRTAMSISGIRWAAEAIVPALIEALKDKDTVNDPVVGYQSVCEAALVSLAWLGPKAKAALPEVIVILEGSNDRLRDKALDVLRAMGDCDERVPLALYKLMTSHKEKAVQLLAAAHLSRLGPNNAEAALPMLLEGLDVRDVADQSPGGPADGRIFVSARALGAVGPLAEKAVPKLRRILDDPRRRSSHDAVKEALQKIRP